MTKPSQQEATYGERGFILAHNSKLPTIITKSQCCRNLNSQSWQSVVKSRRKECIRASYSGCSLQSTDQHRHRGNGATLSSLGLPTLMNTVKISHRHVHRLVCPRQPLAETLFQDNPRWWVWTNITTPFSNLFKCHPYKNHITILEMRENPRSC